MENPMVQVIGSEEKRARLTLSGIFLIDTNPGLVVSTSKSWETAKNILRLTPNTVQHKVSIYEQYDLQNFVTLDVVLPFPQQIG